MYTVRVLLSQLTLLPISSPMARTGRYVDPLYSIGYTASPFASVNDCVSPSTTIVKSYLTSTEISSSTAEVSLTPVTVLSSLLPDNVIVYVD